MKKILHMLMSIIFGAQLLSMSALAQQNMQRADDQLRAFFEKSWQQELDRSPEFKAYLGIKDQDYGKWNDRSDAYKDQVIAAAKTALAAIEDEIDYDQLSDQMKVSYDFFVTMKKRQIASDRYRRHVYVVDQEGGQIAALFVMLQNNHMVDTKADAEAYVERMRGLSTVLNQMMVLMKDRESFGVLPPAFAFPKLIAGTTTMIKGYPADEQAKEVNALYADFKAKVEALDIDKAEQAALLDAGKDAFLHHIKPATEAMIALLKDQSTRQDRNDGVWALPDGDAYYADLLKEHTTLDISAEEVHQTGLGEVARIHAEMSAIKEKVGFQGSLQDFFTYLLEWEDNYYPNTAAGRSQFLKDSKDQSDAVFAVADKFFHRLPKANFEVRAVEKWREDVTGIAFYDSPSLDGTRPGVYYVNLKDMSLFKKNQYVSVAYHEGVPGHHFQTALAQEQQAIPAFQKFTWNSAYSEGWGLYAERLAKEMGFFTDPYQDFGRLEEELWRAIRLVVDSGIHAKRWSREDAIAYAKENSPYNMSDIVSEVERFIAWPGQAVSYKVGMNMILELRAEAKTALGDRFDIRDFHQVVLDDGSVPLTILQKKVRAYIKANQ